MQNLLVLQIYSSILFNKYQENHMLENANRIPHAPANVANICDTLFKFEMMFLKLDTKSIQLTRLCVFYIL